MARGIKPCCGNSGFTTDFVGRRAELSQLEAVAGEAASGNSWVVLIEGSAGVGKTALLRRAMTGLWDSCVLHASCDPSEADLPFGLMVRKLPNPPEEFDRMNVLVESMGNVATLL